jgi:hypothetical protein
VLQVDGARWRSSRKRHVDGVANGAADSATDDAACLTLAPPRLRSLYASCSSRQRLFLAEGVHESEHRSRSRALPTVIETVSGWAPPMDGSPGLAEWSGVNVVDWVALGDGSCGHVRSSDEADLPRTSFASSSLAYRSAAISSWSLSAGVVSLMASNDVASCIQPAMNSMNSMNIICITHEYHLTYIL